MKITQEVRDFAAKQEAASPLPLAGGAGGGPVSEAAADEGIFSPEAARAAEEGMKDMSKRFHEEGGELYVPAGE
jgi:phosphomethylpyrimidine synthase